MQPVVRCSLILHSPERGMTGFEVVGSVVDGVAAAAAGVASIPGAPGRCSEWITIDWAFMLAAGSFLRAIANARPSAVSSGLSRS